MRQMLSLRIEESALAAVDRIAVEQGPFGAARSDVLRRLLSLGLGAWLAGYREAAELPRHGRSDRLR